MFSQLQDLCTLNWRWATASHSKSCALLRFSTGSTHTLVLKYLIIILCCGSCPSYLTLSLPLTLSPSHPLSLPPSPSLPLTHPLTLPPPSPSPSHPLSPPPTLSPSHPHPLSLSPTLILSPSRHPLLTSLTLSPSRHPLLTSLTLSPSPLTPSPSHPLTLSLGEPPPRHVLPRSRQDHLHSLCRYQHPGVCGPQSAHGEPRVRAAGQEGHGSDLGAEAAGLRPGRHHHQRPQRGVDSEGQRSGSRFVPVYQLAKPPIP